MYIIDEWTCSAVAFLVVGRCNLYAPSAWRPVAPFAWKNAKFIGRGQQIIRRFFRQSLRFLPCWAKKERPRSASIWNTVCTTWNLPWGDKMAYGNASAWCHTPTRQGGRAMFRQKRMDRRIKFTCPFFLAEHQGVEPWHRSPGLSHFECDLLRPLE